MTCIRMNGAIVCMGGPDLKIVDEGGRRWDFEMHPYCGPAVTTQKGYISATQPGERASFWRVTSWWAQQGKKIDAEGFCVWVAPTPTHKAVHIVGCHYKLVKV